MTSTHVLEGCQAYTTQRELFWPTPALLTNFVEMSTTKFHDCLPYVVVYFRVKTWCMKVFCFVFLNRNINE